MSVPKFVSMEGTILRLGRNGSTYWRDAGAWGVGWELQDGVLLSVMPSMDWMHHIPLIEATAEQYLHDNEGYVPERVRAAMTTQQKDTTQ